MFTTGWTSAAMVQRLWSFLIGNDVLLWRERIHRKAVLFCWSCDKEGLRNYQSLGRDATVFYVYVPSCFLRHQCWFRLFYKGWSHIADLFIGLVFISIEIKREFWMKLFVVEFFNFEESRFSWWKCRTSLLRQTVHWHEGTRCGVNYVHWYRVNYRLLNILGLNYVSTLMYICQWY